MNRRSANIALYVNEPVDAEVGAQVLHPMTQLAILQFRPCLIVLRFLQFVFLLLEHAKRRLQQIVALRRVTFTLFCYKITINISTQQRRPFNGL